MRTKLRSRLSLLCMTFALMLAIPAVALADHIANRLGNRRGGGGAQRQPHHR